MRRRSYADIATTLIAAAIVIAVIVLSQRLADRIGRNMRADSILPAEESCMRYGSVYEVAVKYDPEFGCLEKRDGAWKKTPGK